MAARFVAEQISNLSKPGCLGLLKVFDQREAAAAFPFLLEEDQPTSLAESDQDVDVFGHDDEAETQAITFRSDFFQKVNDDSLAAILIEQLSTTVTGERDEVRRLQIVDDPAAGAEFRCGML